VRVGENLALFAELALGEFALGDVPTSADACTGLFSALARLPALLDMLDPAVPQHIRCSMVHGARESADARNALFTASRSSGGMNSRKPACVGLKVLGAVSNIRWVCSDH